MFSPLPPVDCMIDSYRFSLVKPHTTLRRKFHGSIDQSWLKRGLVYLYVLRQEPARNNPCPPSSVFSRSSLHPSRSFLLPPPQNCSGLAANKGFRSYCGKISSVFTHSIPAPCRHERSLFIAHLRTNSLSPLSLILSFILSFSRSLLYSVSQPFSPSLTLTLSFSLTLSLSLSFYSSSIGISASSLSPNLAFFFLSSSSCAWPVTTPRPTRPTKMTPKTRYMKRRVFFSSVSRAPLRRRENQAMRKDQRQP